MFTNFQWSPLLIIVFFICATIIICKIFNSLRNIIIICHLISVRKDITSSEFALLINGTNSNWYAKTLEKRNEDDFVEK